MTKDELLELLRTIQITKCETNTLEIKAASDGCPKRLYDTLSGFSNQDGGGIIVFGVDEAKDYLECGVYDPQDLQKKVNEQCLQMEPVVRPLLTVAEKEGKCFVSAEIPGIDLSERPCYYKGAGRMKGSYVRAGESDEPMTEYEIYSYEAFRKKHLDDIRPVPRASFSVLDPELLEKYLSLLKKEKPNLSSMSNDAIYDLMSIRRDGMITLSALLLFCQYPQVFFPQLSIVAIALPGEEIGEPGSAGERFLDNKRIEGNLPQMLDQAIDFVQRNMRIKTIINPDTGKREDRGDYPITAIREIVLNALVHRDYSIHTESKPIQLTMYPSRITISSPGGIYGRITIDQLGKVQPDTRNPVLATAMEVLQLTENRYSGIPTIRRSVSEYGLLDPVFTNERETFSVTLYNDREITQGLRFHEGSPGNKEEELLRFLKTPRTRLEIAKHLGLGTTQYAMQTYIKPLIDQGLVKMTIPGQPRSQSQKFYSVSLR